MTLQKRYLETFYKTLKGTEGVLTLSEGRTRDSFMKPLTEVTQTFETDRKVIYEKFCLKNEDGTPEISEGNYKFKPTELDDINKELNILLDEEVELPDTEGLKEIMERTQYKPLVGEAEVIDTIISKL